MSHMATRTSAPNTQAVWAALDVLTDPEIPVVTLREMGILRDVRIEGNAVEVVITPTYSGCPAMEQIHDDIVSTVKALGVDVRVTTQLAPSIVLQFASKAMARDVVPCPRCNSHETTETSHFGSTACKSLYKCLSCMEPFDYLKPY